MPTKTNYNSPVTFDLSAIGTMMSRPAQQIVTSGAAKPIAQLATQVAPNIAKKGLGALIGGALKANPIGAALTGAKAILGGIGEVVRDRREAKAAGEEYKFGEGLKDFGAGALRGATGIDLTDQDVYEDQTPTYTTNIDPMTGREIPLTMTGKEKPLKMLTGVKGNIPHNMSAAQYKSSLKMQQISGAAPLQANAFYASLNAAKEEGRDTFEVGGKTFNVKENTKSAATAVGDVKKYSTIDDDPNQRAYSGDVKKYSTVDEAPNQRAYSVKKEKLKPASELSKFEKAEIFNKYAMETGLSPNFDSIRATDTTENKTAATEAMKKFYSNPDNVRMMRKEKEKYFKNK